MAYAPAALVPGIQRQPLPFGLFSVLQFREGPARWENGILWEKGTCDPVYIIGDPSCAPTDEGRTQATGLPKNLSSNDYGWPSGVTPFTLYGHYSCSLASTTVEDAEAFARTHLVTREEAGAERELWAGTAGLKIAFNKAVGKTYPDLSPVDAVATLEQHIAVEYGSLGVMHMPRSIATVLLARQVLTVSGGRLTTALGTPVVAGAGYPDKEKKIFVTSSLVGYRSEIFAPTAERGDLIDRGTNTLTAIAERSYVIGYDPCGLAAATVDLTK